MTAARHAGQFTSGPAAATRTAAKRTATELRRTAANLGVLFTAPFRIAAEIAAECPLGGHWIYGVFTGVFIPAFRRMFA